MAANRKYPAELRERAVAVSGVDSQAGDRAAGASAERASRGLAELGSARTRLTVVRGTTVQRQRCRRRIVCCVPK